MKFEITGKKIVFACIVLILLGAYLLGYFHMIWDLIAHGKWPTPASTGIALGNLLMFAGFYGLKLRNYVKKSVS